jgi:Putative MetA-pathway of phenol degradation
MIRAHRIFGLVLACTAIASICLGGPPFVTDDPEPVPFKHYELYFGGSYARFHEGEAAAAPFVEFNYGILPEMQFHVFAPAAWVRAPGEGGHYGFGDTELGLKYRFVKETDRLPQVATFPLVELSTGNHHEGLGNGQNQYFLPLWAQKTFGEKWTVYGGGGWWYNPAPDARNYWRFGGVLQREFSEHLSLGGEVYHETPAARDAEGHTAFNVGGFYNFTEHHHLLFSFGRDIDGPNRFQMYVAFQLTN